MRLRAMLARRETAHGAATATQAARPRQPVTGLRDSRRRGLRQPPRQARRRTAPALRRAKYDPPAPRGAQARPATSDAQTHADKVAETPEAMRHVPRVQPTTRSPLQPVVSGQ